MEQVEFFRNPMQHSYFQHIKIDHSRIANPVIEIPDGREPLTDCGYLSVGPTMDRAEVYARAMTDVLGNCMSQGVDISRLSNKGIAAASMAGQLRSAAADNPDFEWAVLGKLLISMRASVKTVDNHLRSVENKIYFTQNAGLESEKELEGMLPTFSPRSWPRRIKLVFQRPTKKRKCNHALPPHAKQIMWRWYRQNIHRPYPSPAVKHRLADDGGITVNQVTHWFVNIRRRPSAQKAMQDLQ